MSGSVVSEERKAQLLAMLEDELGIGPDGKPKSAKKPEEKSAAAAVVVSDAKVVRDALVRVSPDDPNYRGSEGGVVKVRKGEVIVRIDLWERQQALAREERQRRRELDPFRLSLYGPIDDDE